MHTIITGNKCKFCEMAKNLLVKEGIKFDEINITDRETAKRVFKAMGGTTVPRIYDEQGQLIGGYTELAAKLEKLDLSGEGI